MNNNPTLIILAGGKSTRMGKPKGLLPFKNNYWLLTQIDAFTNGNTVCIGLGFDYQLYFEAIPWLQDAVKNPQEYNGKKVRVVLNLTPELGLFSTLHAVLTILKKNQQEKEIFILPVDVPLLKTSLVEKMKAVNNKVVIPSYQQKNGHPVKLQYPFWKKLLSIDIRNKEARLDIQIKKLPKTQVSIFATNDENCVKNLNTPKNWTEFISEFPFSKE